MSGEPLRDAFAAALDDVLGQDPAIPWTRKDTVNTAEDPDVATPYLDLEFFSAQERQYSFGAPGANLHHEPGQVTIKLHVPLGDAASQALAGGYANTIRQRFRMKRFTMTDGQQIRITGTARMGDGYDEAGMWVESIGLAYETYNVG
jgi:hypothetical protein